MGVMANMNKIIQRHCTT